MRRTCPDRWGALCPRPIPRSAFQCIPLLPSNRQFRIPLTSPTPRTYTRDSPDTLRLPSTLLISFSLLLIYLLALVCYRYPTLSRRTHDIKDIVMRRALTTGLALYLGLGGVLSSPVQVQAPFDLNRENIPEVEDLPGSASGFFFFSVALHRGLLVVESTTGIERTRLIQIVVI